MNNSVGDQAEQASQHGKGRRGQAGHNGQKPEQRGRNGQRFGLGENLPADILAQMTAILFRGNAGNDDSGCGRNDQSGDLRHQPRADGEKGVGLGRRGRVHPLLDDSNNQATHNVGYEHDDSRNRVALDELHGAVH